MGSEGWEAMTVVDTVVLLGYATAQVDQASAITAYSTLAMAILTALLVSATVFAVVFGARAAASATGTYRLESEPVITVRLIDRC